MFFDTSNDSKWVRGRDVVGGVVLIMTLFPFSIVVVAVGAPGMCVDCEPLSDVTTLPVLAAITTDGLLFGRESAKTFKLFGTHAGEIPNLLGCGRRK